MEIKFNIPYICKNHSEYIKEAILNCNHSGNGVFSKKCENHIENLTGAKKVFMMPSCTASLEMAALLLDLKEGDEIIMPSYTFVSTANAFLLRGAKPIFIDIREDTMNINEDLIEKAISNRTKAIVVVHYAGVACEMNKIKSISDKYKIPIIEDAAQGYLSKYNNKFLGSIGDIGCYSFHETKNISCGEGGAILINNPKYLNRASIIRNKGTNIDKFRMGLVDKYEWVDIGSSFLISEVTSAYLLKQLENSTEITNKRKKIWSLYEKTLSLVNKKYNFKLPSVPKNCLTNYHIFYLILEKEEIRNKFILEIKKFGVSCTFHYIPLHTSKKGILINKDIRFNLSKSEDLSKRIVRLPLYASLKDEEIYYVLDKVKKTLEIIY